jgi:hypothetical protein
MRKQRRTISHFYVGAEPIIYATLVCLSCIFHLCMISTLEPRTNSYVSPYDVPHHYLYPYHCV